MSRNLRAAAAVCALVASLNVATADADDVAGPASDDTTASPSTIPPPSEVPGDPTTASPPAAPDILELDGAGDPVPGPRSDDGARFEPDLDALASTHGSVPVIVTLDGTSTAADLSASLAGTEFVVRREFDGAVALDVGNEALDRLEESALVEAVSVDRMFTASVADVNYLIGADVARARGFDGAGTRIAVIDSGVDLSHPTFAGANDDDATACFVAAPTSDPCADDGGDPNSSSGRIAATPCNSEGCEHGTHVASLALGRGGLGAPPGIAPAAELVPIRIFGRDDTTGRMGARTSDLIAALDHLITVHESEPVEILNLSIGVGLYDPSTPDCNSYLTGDLQLVANRLQTLIARGVQVVAAAGNDGAYRLHQFPACMSGVISVSATGEHDIVAAFSNLSEGSIAAPGVGVLGAVRGGSARLSGTSMATAQVSGALALLRQQGAYPYPGNDARRLRETGARAHTGDFWMYAWRIDVAAALGLRPPPARSLVAISAQGTIYQVSSDSFYGRRFSPPEYAVGAARHPDGYGFWIASNTGRVQVNNVKHFGDRHGLPLNAPIIAMAATPTGEGYWLLSSDGGIFCFGDAKFYGSTGNMRLNAPVTDIAVTPSGRGYWLTAMDGGVFTFGDAQFYGSTGNMRLNQPVVSIAATTTGSGYWLVALDGGIFTFGNAPFLGSLPGIGITGETGYRIRSTQEGRGYYISTLEGGIYPFGTANWFGHVPDPDSPIVEIMPF